MIVPYLTGDRWATIVLPIGGAGRRLRLQWTNFYIGQNGRIRVVHPAPLRRGQLIAVQLICRKFRRGRDAPVDVKMGSRVGYFAERVLSHIVSGNDRIGAWAGIAIDASERPLWGQAV